MVKLFGAVRLLSTVYYLFSAGRLGVSTADAELTPLGKDQAQAVNTEWKSELEFNIPVPKKRYSSPMTRALNTYTITFDGIPAQGRPLVLEVRQFSVTTRIC